MTHPSDVFEAMMAFSRAEDLRPDARGDGVLRAPHHERLADFTPAEFAQERCVIRDCEGPSGLPPSLHAHGFGVADLSGRRALQEAFERVRRRNHLVPEDVRAIRHGMRGGRIALRGGGHLRILYVAPEGFLMRRAGPNGLVLSDYREEKGQSDHEAAANVHVDQDVHGTPVRQLLRGLAPYLFHHDSPSAQNLWSPLFLVNVWVPLQQIVRPLVLADRASLDRRTQQARMALPTEELFDRAPDRRFNDIWTMAYHPSQRWYFHPEMRATEAYVFETLSTPHGACILPGEAEAERLYRELGEALDALEGREHAGPSSDHGHRAAGLGPRAPGPGPRATGHGTRAAGDGPRAAGGGPRAAGGGRRATGDGRGATGLGPRASGDGPWAPGDGVRETGTSRSPDAGLDSTSTPAPLARANARMRALLASLPEPASSGVAAWREEARQARDAVVRKSIEMRAVAYVSRPRRRALPSRV